MMNSATYYNQSSPVTAPCAPPCGAGMIDVKLTETDLPWYSGSARSSAYQCARASRSSRCVRKGRCRSGFRCEPNCRQRLFRR
jgi:hypothetical protein